MALIENAFADAIKVRVTYPNGEASETEYPSRHEAEQAFRRECGRLCDGWTEIGPDIQSFCVESNKYNTRRKHTVEIV